MRVRVVGALFMMLCWSVSVAGVQASAARVGDQGAASILYARMAQIRVQHPEALPSVCLQLGDTYLVAGGTCTWTYTLSSSASVSVSDTNLYGATLSVDTVGTCSGSCTESGTHAAGTMTVTVSGGAGPGWIGVSYTYIPSEVATPSGSESCPDVTMSWAVNLNLCGGYPYSSYPSFAGPWSPTGWVDSTPGSSGYGAPQFCTWANTSVYCREKGITQTVSDSGATGGYLCLDVYGAASMVFRFDGVDAVGTSDGSGGTDYCSVSRYAAHSSVSFLVGSGSDGIYFAVSAYVDSTPTSETATVIAGATATQVTIDQATVVAQGTASAVAQATLTAAPAATQTAAAIATVTAARGATQTAVAVLTASAVPSATPTAGGAVGSPTDYVPATPISGTVVPGSGTPVDGSTVVTCTNIVCACLENTGHVVTFAVNGVATAIAGVSNGESGIATAVAGASGGVRSSIDGGASMVATAVAGISVHGVGVITATTDLVGPVGTAASQVSGSVLSAGGALTAAISNTGVLVDSRVLSATTSLDGAIGGVADAALGVRTSVISATDAISGVGVSIDTASISTTAYLAHLGHLDDINNDLQACVPPLLCLTHVGIGDSVAAFVALATADSVAAGATLAGDSVALGAEGGVLVADETVVMADTTAAVATVGTDAVALGGVDFFSKSGSLVRQAWAFWQANQLWDLLQSVRDSLSLTQSDAYSATTDLVTLDRILPSLPLSITAALTSSVVQLFVPTSLVSDTAPLVAQVSAKVPSVAINGPATATCVSPVMFGATIPMCEVMAPMSSFMHAVTTALIALLLLSSTAAGLAWAFGGRRAN